MAFDPKNDYAGKSSTPGKAGGYDGGVKAGGGPFKGGGGYVAPTSGGMMFRGPGAWVTPWSSGAATARAGKDPFGNDYIRGADGGLRIRAPVSRFASANPFDFIGMVGPHGIGTLATGISLLGRNMAERSFGTLGRYRPGVPQTQVAMQPGMMMRGMA